MGSGNEWIESMFTEENRKKVAQWNRADIHELDSHMLHSVSCIYLVVEAFYEYLQNRVTSSIRPL